jgi:malonyl CoA-acyl carrier protein transacylase
MPVHAFVFPGQGSQSVGMGRDLAAAFAPAREVFQEVDEVLRQKLSKLMFEGPAEDLTLTENTCVCWRRKAASCCARRQSSSRGIRSANTAR